MATKLTMMSVASLILSGFVLSAAAAESEGESVMENSSVAYHIHEVTSPASMVKGSVSESQKNTEMVDMEAVQLHLFTTYRNL